MSRFSKDDGNEIKRSDSLERLFGSVVMTGVVGVCGGAGFESGSLLITRLGLDVSFLPRPDEDLLSVASDLPFVLMASFAFSLAFSLL